MATAGESTTGMFHSIPEDDGFASEQAAGTQTRTVQAPTRRLGKMMRTYDPRKWGAMDMARGITANVAYEVTRDDRMSPGEAHKKLLHIWGMYGIERASEGDQLAFTRGMFLCHAVNSGSVLQPARSKIFVRGNEFDYKPVVDYLGPDQRRFFRAYADDVRKELLRVLGNYDPDDFNMVDVHSWIQEKAVDRGLQRVPDLIADSASACTGLGLAERSLLNRSLNLVLSSVINAADSMQARAKPISADQFDSTNGQRIENAVRPDDRRA